VLDTAELAEYELSVNPNEHVDVKVNLALRRQSRRDLERLWQQMAGFGPAAAEYVARRSGAPPTWPGLTQLVAAGGPDCAAVSLLTLADRTLFFALRAGWEEPAVVEARLDPWGWDDLLRRLRFEVHYYDGSNRRRETWQQPLHEPLEDVWLRLGGASHLIIAPHRGGHLLPWMVVAERAGWRYADRGTAALTEVPALGMLHPSHLDLGAPADSPLIVGNPRGDLIHAEREAILVAERLGAEPLLGKHATKEAVLSRIATAKVIHLATHAQFDGESPLDSSIVLADGSITAREALQLRVRADLLVLSGCETGITGTLGGEEWAGLTQAFLQAGVRSLLVSRWKVNDPATAELMGAFYGAWAETGDKAVALQRAVTQVRTQAPWTHPFWWGGFTLIGNR
jgi:hypothetical protein